MSCYAGDSEAYSFSHEEWYPFTIFHDPNVLVQLCRVINEFRGEWSLSPYSFHRIGTSTIDDIFLTVDYESNHSWNPLQDYHLILLDCNEALGFSNIEWITEECYAKQFSPGFSPIGWNVEQFKEKFKSCILYLREFLDGDFSITVEPWSSDTASFTVLDLDGEIIDSSGFQQQLTPSDIEFVPGPPWDRWRVKRGFGFNESPGEPGCEPNELTVVTPITLQIGFKNAGDGGVVTDGEGNILYYYSDFEAYGDFCDSFNPSLPSGWIGWTATTYCKKQWEIASDLPMGIDLSLFEGATIDWTLEHSYFGTLPNIGWEASVYSGSYVLVSGGVLNTDPIEIEFNTTDLTGHESTGALSGVNFSLSVTPVNFNLCKDACGNYHLDEE